MKQLRLIWHDVRQGMVYNRYKLLLAVLMGFIGGAMFIRIYSMVNGNLDGATFMQCVAYVYKGEKYIPPEMIKDMYILPAMWLGIQVVIGYLVGYYPVDDLHTYGQQVLIRSRKRTVWWLSKCVWGMSTVVLVYVIMDVVMLGMCLVMGMSITGGINEETLCSSVYDIAMYKGTTRNVIIFTFIMPVVVSVAVSIVQMALAMMFSPMVGFIVVEAWALMATFTVSGAAIHNYGALAHTIICSPSNIKYSTGGVVCLAVALAGVVVGAVYFNRCNILAKE